MIPAVFYQFFYLLFVAIITLVVASKYNVSANTTQFNYLEKETSVWLIVLFMVLFIGFRPLDMLFVDMGHYAEMYMRVYDGIAMNFSLTTDNIIFDNLLAWWGSVRLGYTSFFVFIALIYFGCAYLGIRRLFPTHKLAAYLVFLAAFSTFSYGTNGIKAGAAASIFIWAMGYRDNMKICIPLVLLSWGFHHSMQLPVAAFILTWFYKSPKVYYYTWAFCMLMALMHVGAFASLFASYSDERGAGYLTSVNGGMEGTKGGFRIDFIIYSAIPILIGYIMEMKRKIQVSPLYRDIIHLYICINGIWMLCMYAEFTNRIAYLSWFLYPIVLIYPFLCENWGSDKYMMFGRVMRLHLGFTIFMNMIYYGGILKLFT